MLDLLRDYLNDATTPEMTEAIRAACELFDQFGLDTYEQDYEGLLMLDGNADQNATFDSIYDMTKAVQHKLLEEHGVVISEDARISELNVFLRALRLLEGDYDAPEQIISTIGMEGVAEDIFVELVQLVIGRDSEAIAHLVTHVDQRLLQLIMQRAEANHAVVLSHDEQVLKQQRVILYNNFVQFAQLKNLKLAYLLTHGLDVGHPFNTYLNLIGQDFNEMEPQAIAHELICMAFVSADAWANPRIEIKKHLDSYLSDIDKITKVDLFVNDLLLKFNSYAKI
jgi:hypothetical protein